MTYEKCLVELDEVLGYLVLEDLEKIPKEVRDAITNNKDESYKWEYDTSKDLSEQKLNRKTVAMLSYLNMEYMQTEEERKLMEEYHKLNTRIKMSKKDIQNYEVVFNKSKEKEEIEVNDEKALTNIVEEKWYKKFFNCIRKILK